MDLNRIDAFMRVMEAGSFTAAAQAMGVPKSTLSRAVSKLERELGVVLLQRTTRSLTITEPGQQFLSRAQSALGLLAEARAQLAEANLEPRGLVRITAATDSSGVLADALLSFARRYPGIRVECTLTPRRIDLVAEGIDLALRAGVLDSASLVGRKLGDSPMGLFAAPSYLQGRPKPHRLRDLREHECVLFRGVQGKSRWTLSGKRGAETVEVRGALSVDELSYALTLTLRGAGVALLPTPLVREAVARGELVRLLPGYQQHGVAVYLVYPASRTLPRRVALLRDHLYEALRGAFE